MSARSHAPAASTHRKRPRRTALLLALLQIALAVLLPLAHVHDELRQRHVAHVDAPGGQYDCPVADGHEPCHTCRTFQRHAFASVHRYATASAAPTVLTPPQYSFTSGLDASLELPNSRAPPAV